ncbi:MAG: hypothetical protein AVDCRST_MAG80-74, partial [uncultured Rubrobacteraceae bacterium]
LVGLPSGVQEAQGRGDAHRAGDDLRGTLLSDAAPRAPAAWGTGRGRDAL